MMNIFFEEQLVGCSSLKFLSKLASMFHVLRKAGFVKQKIQLCDEFVKNMFIKKHSYKHSNTLHFYSILEMVNDLPSSPSALPTQPLLPDISHLVLCINKVFSYICSLKLLLSILCRGTWQK